MGLMMVLWLDNASLPITICIESGAPPAVADGTMNFQLGSVSWSGSRTALFAGKCVEEGEVGF
jgi:hypothetical protein